MKFIKITKPGIIFGNIISLCGGFFLATKQDFLPMKLLLVAISMSLIIASGCVFNNVIDRDIDRLMNRTKNRILPQNLMSINTAICYAILLGLLGLTLLIIKTNLLTTLLAAVAWLIYVHTYSIWLKRQSIYGTLIGGIAGAAPPVIGYCSLSNHFDTGAIILFFMLFLWQIPHAYAIAIYRLSDYQQALIPVLPTKKGIFYTKITILYYTIAFLIAALSPTLLGYTGLSYFIVALIMTSIFLALGIKGFMTDNNKKWAKQLFLFSIINITTLSMMMLIK